jgi:uncharacterized membrane-anchored protein
MIRASLVLLVLAALALTVATDHTASPPAGLGASLENRLEPGDWTAARSLMHEAHERKIVPPISAGLGRAALLAACAANVEQAADAKTRALALDYAGHAARLAPSFAPGALIE